MVLVQDLHASLWVPKMGCWLSHPPGRVHPAPIVWVPCSSWGGEAHKGRPRARPGDPKPWAKQRGRRGLPWWRGGQGMRVPKPPNSFGGTCPPHSPAKGDQRVLDPRPVALGMPPGHPIWNGRSRPSNRPVWGRRRYSTPGVGEGQHIWREYGLGLIAGGERKAAYASGRLVLPAWPGSMP